MNAAAANVAVGPPPTTKPPTPPQLARGSTGTLGKSAGNTGTLGKGSREYRTPPVVVPPQVPSHYAPNYPVGHPRRQTSEKGPGYSAIPVPPSQQIATHIHPTQAPIGMVHPLPPPPSTAINQSKNFVVVSLVSLAFNHSSLQNICTTIEPACPLHHHR